MGVVRRPTDQRCQERGEFDELPGAGKPLPDLGRPRDEVWWVRKKLKDEDLTYLPPTLQARKNLEDALGQIARARSEDAVRQLG